MVFGNGQELPVEEKGQKLQDGKNCRLRRRGRTCRPAEIAAETGRICRMKRRVVFPHRMRGAQPVRGGGWVSGEARVEKESGGRAELDVTKLEVRRGIEF